MGKSVAFPSWVCCAHVSTLDPLLPQGGGVGRGKSLHGRHMEKTPGSLTPDLASLCSQQPPAASREENKAAVPAAVAVFSHARVLCATF